MPSGTGISGIGGAPLAVVSGAGRPFHRGRGARCRNHEKARRGGAGRAVCGLRLLSAFAVVLNPSRPETGEAMLVDGGLPVEELVDTQSISRAGFLEAEKTTANGGNHFSFTTNNPTAGILWRQIRDGERTPIRANHVLDARAHLYGHFTHLLNLTMTLKTRATRLKFG